MCVSDSVFTNDFKIIGSTIKKMELYDWE